MVKFKTKFMNRKNSIGMDSLKGSKKCVLEFINLKNFLTILNSLVQSTGAVITPKDKWVPFLKNDKEAELKDFLSQHFDPKHGLNIRNWWLAVSTPQTRTPNWDLVSTCKINNKMGILLVEAKAHRHELEKGGKPENVSNNSKANHERIRSAIGEANKSINEVIEGVSISIDNCYQLSNRVAHAWWLANQGIPSVLLYLGFLNVEDMRNKYKIFETAEEWEKCFIAHAKIIGVDNLIDKQVFVGTSSFVTISRAL